MEKMSYSSGWRSVDDVAAYLGIKRGTVYKWVARYGLPARKVGRLLKFRREDIDRWMETRRMGGAAGESGARYLRLLREAAPGIKRHFGVRSIGLFGSTARGEAGPDSDVDVLVEFDQPTFDRYMDLKFHLEDLFGRPCDLVLDESIKESLRESVHREVLYA